MNRIVPIGLGAAAVIAVAVVGSQLLGSPAPGGVGASSSPPAAAATPAPTAGRSPSPPAVAGLPRGPFVINGSAQPVRITVDVASSGWFPLTDFDALAKDDDGLDAPEHVGGLLVTSALPVGTGINVYGDPCAWSTTVPAAPATTPAEIAAALAAQTASDPSTPVDVTIGGFSGTSVTLHVPMSYDLPGATRDEKFAACDEATYAFYGIEGETGNARNAQGAGQIDELWILDVDGSIVILDAAYSPSTPAALIDELRALAESATFE